MTERPPEITYIVWHDPRFADARLWQEMLLISLNARSSKDVQETAIKMYEKLGGEILSYTEVSKRQQAAKTRFNGWRK